VNNCNICGKNNSVSAKEVITKGKTYRLVKCANCGLACINPLPEAEEIKNSYDSDYYSFNELSSDVKDKASGWRLEARKIFIRYYFGGWGEIGLWERLSLFFLKSRFGPLSERIGKKGKILDIGAGDGFFLEMVRGLGWEVAGVELESGAAVFASQRGLSVFGGELVEAKYKDNSFDVVHLSHVLEHTTDPRATIREVQRILKPGGKIIIKVPNFLGLAYKIFPQALDIPRHLFHFNKRNLSILLSSTGFKNIKIKHYSVGVIQAHLLKVFQKIYFTPLFLFIDIIFNSMRRGDSFVISAYK